MTCSRRLSGSGSGNASAKAPSSSVMVSSRGPGGGRPAPEPRRSASSVIASGRVPRSSTAERAQRPQGHGEEDDGLLHMRHAEAPVLDREGLRDAGSPLRMLYGKGVGVSNFLRRHDPDQVRGVCSQPCRCRAPPRKRVRVDTPKNCSEYGSAAVPAVSTINSAERSDSRNSEVRRILIRTHRSRICRSGDLTRSREQRRSIAKPRRQSPAVASSRITRPHQLRASQTRRSRMAKRPDENCHR